MKSVTSWQQAAIAGVVGAVAFGAGALLRGQHKDAETADAVVAAVPRAVTPVTKASGDADSATRESSRLEPDVAFNPFAALNLGAPATLGQPKDAPLRPKPVMQAVVAPPLPPPPAAPPLPFIAIGSLTGADVTDGQPVAFLQQQDQLFVVRAGQAVGGNYRVESITPARIELTYLPLNQRQSLPLAP